MRRSLLLFSVDPFRTLGLERSASREEVKSKYHELARKHHPDSGAVDGDVSRMEEINRAYNQLIKEGMYDRLGGGRASEHASYADSKRAELYASLNLSSELVTPDGRFKYQRSDTGEWVTVDEPLTRPRQPRYGSFQQAKVHVDLNADILNHRTNVEKRAAALRPGLLRRFATASYSIVPWESIYVRWAIIAFYGFMAVVMYRKAHGFQWKYYIKEGHFRKIRNKRAEITDVYPVLRDEMTLLAAAQVVVLVAATLAHAARDPNLQDPAVQCGELYPQQPTRRMYRLEGGG